MGVLGTDFPQERTSISGKCCACPASLWVIHPGDHSNQLISVMNAGIGKAQMYAIFEKILKKKVVPYLRNGGVHNITPSCSETSGSLRATVPEK